jgi:uncharacterized protein
MQYRKFGKLNWDVSILGFGCMRLPTKDNNPWGGNIDEAQAIPMIRYAIDNGVNYVDTAYLYHAGNSEVVTGKALKDGYRQKVKLATKSPIMIINKNEDFDNYLNDQLKKLQTDHIDMYLLHGLGQDNWDNVVLKFDILKKAEAAVRGGRIGHIGFSFHDSHDAFNKIVDGYNSWSFCQVQYNYMDTENQAGTAGVRYAASKGLGVICMEPIMGGRLARPSEEIKKLFDASKTKRTPAEWALQWVWDQPEVCVLLSGMGTIAQVKENLASADRAAIISFSKDDLKFIEQVRKAFKERAAIQCTRCGYCLPCPQGVNIPGLFELYNNNFIFKDAQTAAMTRFMYQRFFKENERADACVQCRLCEEKCPQKLNISELMQKVKDMLSPKK